MIRVLLADDHDIVRAGLRRLVEDCGDMEVVAEAADGQEAILRVQETSPEVASPQIEAIFDVAMSAGAVSGKVSGAGGGGSGACGSPPCSSC